MGKIVSGRKIKLFSTLADQFTGRLIHISSDVETLLPRSLSSVYRGEGIVASHF